MSEKSGKKVVIAVDGPAAAGKTTTCLALAETFDLRYLESGRPYRIVAYEALRRGVAVDDGRAVVGLCDDLIDESRSTNLLASTRYQPQELRSVSVNRTVSAVARIGELRGRVTELIHLWANAQARCVVEGRDIGTVVFPSAPAKFYLTARPETRAKRRVRQEGRGSYEDVLKDVIRRDEADMSRTVSPLKPASDAVEIDTTSLSVDQVVGRMVDVCRTRGVAIP
ncbi:(d)CMP kinase [Amycolatopsis sp. YIM 10]|uniref:(d)CMP kinase n=1 Tax=Amycolatopsis sp. YIM 10 TaxID=2653857 RepID=UPI00128FEEC1|nr:(d)CMP kinase [Amycolatopsis sp. YIM 10]QFU85877.1 Cytidylate kinase [Amycolatopsis sp. YIM 10]